MPREKIIVTSALLYVNNFPHLGNLVCVISADAYARYLKSRGQEVISVLGTDEHGTTTEIKAIQEGLSPKEITDKYFKIHKKVYDFFLCEPDCFGRTSSNKNKEITVHLFKRLDENGYISEGELEQYFCPKCNRALADRFVKGKCKICGYENARGDQCEKCGSLLEPNQLDNPRCAICGGEVKLRKSNHLFLDLPALSKELKGLLEAKKQNWSYNAVTMTQSWLERGLKKRCISRDLKWGIPIPKKGFENKVFYSWFDAPIGYIGITAENREDWEDWWKSESTRLVQFMGKDNIPFHTILFPGILIGSRENYILLDTISVNEYLNYEGGKFSKSQHKGIFGDDVASLNIRPDVWRYYIIINRPEKADTDFTWEDFREKLNNELVANFGNLIQRIIVFLKNKYNLIMPDLTLEEQDKKFLSRAHQHAKKVEELFDKIQLKAALKEIMKLASLGNQYMQENKPWSDEVSQARKDTAMNVLANFAKDLAILVYPIMPQVSKDIFEQLNIEEEKWDFLGKMSIKAGHKVNEPKPLFKKISDEEMQSFKQRFSQAKDENKPEKDAGKGSSQEEKQEKKLDFEALDLRVGWIKEVKEHPNADKLWVIKVDLGEEERQLVAGLRKEYSSEELEGKNIVVVSNLKPAKLRGIESQGMLLAGEGKAQADIGEDDAKTEVGLITSEAEPGTRVCLKGKEKDKQSSPQTITIDELFDNFNMEVRKGLAYINGEQLFAGGKPLLCERVFEGKIR